MEEMGAKPLLRQLFVGLQPHRKGGRGERLRQAVFFCGGEFSVFHGASGVFGHDITAYAIWINSGYVRHGV